MYLNSSVPDLEIKYSGLVDLPGSSFVEPVPARFSQPFEGFGFDPRLVDYLARQAQLSATEAGVAYEYNPTTQTFTGFTMMGPVTVTLETMLQRAGLKPIPSSPMPDVIPAQPTNIPAQPTNNAGALLIGALAALTLLG